MTAKMIHTDEGSYIPDDITAMGAAKRARERVEWEDRNTRREADDSWSAHLERLENS